VVTSGTTFSVAVQDSTTAESLILDDGSINTDTVVVSSTETTDEYGGMAASTTSPSSVGLGTLGTYDPTLIDAFAAAHNIAPSGVVNYPIPPPCTRHTDYRDNDQQTKIGELHVARGNDTDTGTFKYEQHADSKFSIDVSADLKALKASGSVTLSKTGITGGTVTRGGPYNYFIFGHHDGIQQHANSYTCSSNYRRKVVAWEGDVYPDTSQGGAGGSPWGQCRNAPHWGQYDSHPTFDHYTSTGQWYDAAVTFPFPGVDLSIDGRTGYETNVGYHYDNPAGAATTYFCAAVPLTDAHIIYNTS
jgi:hypothetical protein